MRNKLNAKLLLLLLSFAFISIAGQSQKADVFAAVPDAVRARLVERLNLLVEYEKNGQWRERYDLLYPRDGNEKDYIKNKEEYIKLNTDPDDPRDVIRLSFEPRKITRSDEFGKTHLWSKAAKR